MISMAILIIPPPILNIIIVVITIALMMMPLSRKKLYRIIPAGSLNLLLRCCLWLYCIYFAIPKSGSSVLVALATDKRNDFICTSFWLRPCSMLLDEYICLSTSLLTSKVMTRGWDILNHTIRWMLQAADSWHLMALFISSPCRFRYLSYLLCSILVATWDSAWFLEVSHGHGHNTQAVCPQTTGMFLTEEKVDPFVPQLWLFHFPSVSQGSCYFQTAWAKAWERRIE